MSTNATVTPQEAYPEVLKQRETECIADRRDAIEKDVTAPLVGFALSGGGIRSATFALGLFQSLARAHLLRHIDYLSTVSGGGYFGAFFGALFSRKTTEKVEDVEAILSDSNDRRLRALRNNGNYLAPAGVSDLWLGGAVLLRNWVAVQLIVLSFVLLVFLTAEGALLSAQALFPSLDRVSAQIEFALWEHGVWLSPWLLVPALLLVGVAFPLGWSYWTLERDVVPVRLPRPLIALWTVLPHLVVAGGGVLAFWVADLPWLGLAAFFCAYVGFATATSAAAFPGRSLAFVYGIPAVGGAFALWGPIADFDIVFGDVTRTLTVGLVPVAAAVSAVSFLPVAGASGSSSEKDGVAPSHELSRDTRARHEVSVALRSVLVVTGALLAFAIVHTLGRSLYAAYFDEWRVVLGVSGGVSAFLTAAAGFARKIAVRFTGSTGKRPTASLSLLAWLAAGALALVLLTAVSVATQWITWNGQVPLQETPRITLADTSRCWWACLVLLVLSLLVGTSRSFLNRSTHLPLYSSRITRAYLGASNPSRLEADPDRDPEAPAPMAATRVMPGDDVPAADYWDWPSERRGEGRAAWRKGGPLHIVNVTVNETVDGRTKIAERERKGTCLAVGPRALSLGVRHHLLPGIGEATDETRTRDHHVFEFSKNHWWNSVYPAERLSLGQWTSISGAAYSTGLGSRTQPGLSFLAGFMNVRLGFWWRPGVRRSKSLGRLLTAPFWVQVYLLRELLGRFPGTQHMLWYLSDGGHFENMGAYELIRRRLPFIVVVDAEEDAKGTFEGLGNLVRKARVDFGAEIQFCDDPSQALGAQVPDGLGSLQDLRRDPETGRSAACAALAQVRYAGAENPSTGWLLYVKPALQGELPADLQHYASEHPAFPHEPTYDQFFDEAQWESYRKLGELIGERLFPEAPADDGTKPPAPSILSSMLEGTLPPRPAALGGA